MSLSLSSILANTFLKHPREQGMTYAQHAVHSLTFSVKFARASLQSFVHAFIPSQFQSTTTELTKSLVEQLNNNQAAPHS